MTREELLKIAKPVLFNTKMVSSILAGLKGCTRRVVKFNGDRNPHWTGYIKDGLTLYNGTNEPCNKQALYNVNDILYVRETWCDDRQFTHEDTPGRYFYKASETQYFKWKPSIFMPKEAARIFLKVTGVRMERLQDITIDEIRKEGLSSMAVHARDKEIAYEEWQLLWDSTIDKKELNQYGWDANPWVWVYEFERINYE